MNARYGSTIEARAVVIATGTPPCASTRRTVPWCTRSWAAMVPMGQCSV
jgi:hypothetical protein